jgi:hypothetical protein
LISRAKQRKCTSQLPAAASHICQKPRRTLVLQTSVFWLLFAKLFLAIQFHAYLFGLLAAPFRVTMNTEQNFWSTWLEKAMY